MNRPCFIELCFITLHRCCIFLQIKGKTLHQPKDCDLLYSSGLEPSPHYLQRMLVCGIEGSTKMPLTCLLLHLPRPHGNGLALVGGGVLGICARWLARGPLTHWHSRFRATSFATGWHRNLCPNAVTVIRYMHLFENLDWNYRENQPLGSRG